MGPYSNSASVKVHVHMHVQTGVGTRYYDFMFQLLVPDRV